jgi:hypothetical protein
LSCESSKNCNNLKDIYSDSALYQVDSIFQNVLIEGKECTIKILRDKSEKINDENNSKSDDDWWLNVSPTYLVIYDNSNCNILLEKKYETLKLTLSKLSGDMSKEGNLYLHLISYGGGSGYTSWINKFEFNNNKLYLKELFETNELSSLVFNKTENEIYVFQGIWDMTGWDDCISGETHFSGHKQKIRKYCFINNGFNNELLGTTKYSYDATGKTSSQLLKEIVTKEKSLLPIINPNNYIPFNNWDGTFEKSKNR